MTAMGTVQQHSTDSFNRFFASEKLSGIFLIVCTILSLVMANSFVGEAYLGVWQEYVGGPGS